MTHHIFQTFDERHRALWGKHRVRLEHRLAETGLFSDETLAGLIERTPRSHYNLIHMSAQGESRRFWREGEVGEASGLDVIEAIRCGRMWINLRRVMEVDPRYAALMRDVFGEIEANVPERTFRHNLGILISSPGAQVYYHADVPGQALWQIRGSKRVYLYPNTAPFLKPQEIEGIVLGETEEEIAYESWYDEYAEVIDLQPGEMLHWPLNGPHKVENHDCLNVSVTTEHYTDAIRRQYAVNYANGVLRRRLGVSHPGHAVNGPAFWAKAALAAGWKYGGLQKGYRMERKVDFRVDRENKGQILDIPAYSL